MEQVQYGRFDVWRGVASIDMERAREIRDRLELRARAEDEVAARAAYLDLIAVAPGERVLDVGCGSGVVTRELARRVAPRGLAIGVDPSPALLAVARELADHHGVGEHVDFRVGDARALPFADGDFDVAMAVTSLAHIPDGARAIPELVRVTRAGGRVGIFDRDPDSFIISHPDRALTRRIVAAFSDHASVDGWLARRLPGLLADAGVRDIRVRAFTPLERDASGFYAWYAVRAAEVAVESGAISAEERQGWLDAFRAEQAAGRSLAGMTQLFIWGTRPT
jgi:arsenite methyltransferase